MNKIIKQIFLPLMLMLLIGSCNDDPEYYTLETPPDQMNLVASTDKVVLERIDETKEAITFSWNQAADRGSDTELIYYFRLYHAEMKSLESELIKIDKDTRSVTMTVRELNNLLHSWSITPGDEVTIEAEVLAVVENSTEYMKPEKSITEFNVTGYDTVNKLYITITTGTQKRNLEMNMLEDGVFVWSGELNVCDFWFVRDWEKGAPAYVKGGDANSLVYSSSGEGSPFSTDELKIYYITVDLNTLKIDIKKLDPPSKFYMITSKNGVEKVKELGIIEAGRSVFYLKDEFEAGTEFRFVDDENIRWPAYVRGADDTKLDFKEEVGAQMFKVSKTATYVMTVNMEDLSLIFLDVFNLPKGVIAVIGDVVPESVNPDYSWNAGYAMKYCQLTQKDLINKPEVISYTGKFEYRTTGQNLQNKFKFTGDENWQGGLFAKIANSNPFDANQQEISTDGNGDNKWLLPSSTVTGTYTLEMNLHTMKINLVKQ